MNHKIAANKLILLLVNDLPPFIKEAYIDLYAHDASVHTSGKQQKTVELKLQYDTDDFKNWCSSNHMFIHIGKTSLMTAHDSRQNIGHINIEVFIDGEIIKEVENQKLLEIIIDKTLSWDKQIDTVFLNLTRRITLMKSLSNYIAKSHLTKYYNLYDYITYFRLCIFNMGSMHIIKYK